MQSSNAFLRINGMSDSAVPELSPYAMSGSELRWLASLKGRQRCFPSQSDMVQGGARPCGVAMRVTLLRDEDSSPFLWPA